MPHARPAALETAAAVVLGVLGMVAGHCGVYQVSALLSGPESQGHHHHGHVVVGAHHLAAAPNQVVTHDHLIPMASGAFLVFVVAALLALVAAQRRTAVRVAMPTLIASQLVSFVVLELLMRLAADGPTTPLTDSTVWMALAVQLPVAVLITRLCRRLAEAVEQWRARPAGRLRCAGVVLAAHSAEAPRRGRLHDSLTFAPRGPPF